MQVVTVHRVATGSPDDMSGVQDLFNSGRLRASEIRAVIGKTEGNGCVNDFTRGFALRAIADLLSADASPSGSHVTCVMSGGTEGVMSPHLTIFASHDEESPAASPSDDKRLALGTSATRRILPEELGRAAMVTATAKAVEVAIERAGIDDPMDVHYVQAKCPLLTPERIADAETRGETVVTTDTYRSMAYSRGAAALGIALGLREIEFADGDDSRVLRDRGLYSRVASASAGVELENVEILLLGNSPRAGGDLRIGHAVMQDAIDGRAIRSALRSVGIRLEDGEVPPAEAERVVNVFAKAEADESGRVRNRRHTMLGDSDIHSTRHARAAVSAVIASILGDPMIYVSGGAEHQGPPGGGPVAVIARAD